MLKALCTYLQRGLSDTKRNLSNFFCAKKLFPFFIDYFYLRFVIKFFQINSNQNEIKWIAEREPKV